jgi:hypothetical protein
MLYAPNYHPLRYTGHSTVPLTCRTHGQQTWHRLARRSRPSTRPSTRPSCQTLPRQQQRCLACFAPLDHPRQVRRPVEVPHGQPVDGYLVHLAMAYVVAAGISAQ